MSRPGYRGPGRQRLKRRVLRLLASAPQERAVQELIALPPRRVINPLISALCQQDERIKWRAVTAMGAVVADLAGQDMESARVVLRRLLWMLNQDSGGIGWGAAEAMGEILARHPGLAEEFAPILLSFVQEEEIRQGPKGLLSGALWSVCRLASASPHLLRQRSLDRVLVRYLDVSDDTAKALAILAIGLIGAEASVVRIKAFMGDPTKVRIFWDRRFRTRTLGALSAEALGRIAASKTFPRGGHGFSVHE